MIFLHTVYTIQLKEKQLLNIFGIDPLEMLNLRPLWFEGSFELIQTGFHFCFEGKRHYRDTSNMWEFLIPAGAHIITGIDNTLGVTDQIMLI